ncbi:phage tail tape measure protein [Janthinobacterium lividum]|uniref:Phage tail tape measure protein n=1 Tax=Janthinobacterium lividum TaxID=29581 RepID=A0A1E8PKU9_9BURK|nr:phage tail tape measure protein [Janthinobacterium lividum]
MKLQLIVSGNNNGLNQMLNQSDASVRKFTQGAAGHFTRLQAHASKVWSAINGVSAATKLIGIGAGVGGLKSIIDDNLAFERSLLKIKFNAQMTTKELAELRQMAMDISKTSLNSPLEVVQMQLRLANAGLKMPDIRQLAPVVANAAQVFEAPAGEIADLVFDKITKSGIKNERVPQMLDMLYFHATSGRFETMDMARQAPELLNAGSLVGLNNEAGLNLMGAMTQRMMRNATVQNPSEVSTLIKHGLSHITDPHYVKKLHKIGIDVPKYFDNKGHFKGEGGVEGILALTKAMKEKGLENPFKLGEAGFREQYTRTFWLEMMRSIDAKDTDKDPNLIKMMERGKEAMNSGQLSANLAVIKEANFGKIKAAEIEIQKAKVSSGAQAITGAAGAVAAQFSENPIATTGAAVGTILAGKYLLSKLLGGKGGGLGQAAGAAIGGAGMPVFVTNWPASMSGPIKASERLSRLPGRAGAAGGAAAEGAAAGGVATAMRAGALAAARMAPMLLLSGDSAQGPTKDRGEQISAMDLKMQKLGMKREKGWLFDSYVPITPPQAKPHEPAPDMAGQIIEMYKMQKLGMKRESGSLLDSFVPAFPQTKLPEPAQEKLAAEMREIGKKIDALAQRPVVAQLSVNGRVLADAVNEVNGRDARRQ